MSIEVDDFGQIGRVSATAPDGARIWILLANGVTAVATNSAEPFAFERGDTVLVTGFDVQPAPPEAWPDDAERAVRPDQPWVGVVNLREEEATIVDVGGGLEQVIYVEAVESLRADLGVLLAIETGVNYLRPRADEMPDATFMAAVAERADCGILLDLHNVYCNALNGRQEVESSCPACRSSASGRCTWRVGSSWRTSGSTRTPAPSPIRCSGSVATSFPPCQAARRSALEP